MKTKGEENVVIDLLSSNQKNINAEFKFINQFLENYKYYTEEEIKREDSLMKAMYTVMIVPENNVPDSFLHRGYTFLGKVFIKERLLHKLHRVEINIMGYKNSWTIFEPDKENKVIVYDSDTAKNAKIMGNVVLINSFGKKVKLPFEYNYIISDELIERMKPKIIYTKPN